MIEAVPTERVLRYIKDVEEDTSQELLINQETGELWAVDRYALKERGYPEGGWILYSQVSKETLLSLLYQAKGWSI